MTNLFVVSLRFPEDEGGISRYKKLVDVADENSVDLWSETIAFLMLESELSLADMTKCLEEVIDPAQDILLVIELEEAAYKIAGDYLEKPA